MVINGMVVKFTSSGLLIFLFLLLSAAQLKAHSLRGSVKDDEGEPLPGVAVYIDQTSYGVVTNAKGEFFMELKPGDYQIVFTSLGYESKTVTVSVPPSQILDITLSPSITALEEVTIKAKGRDPAYELIKKASENRSRYLKQHEGLSFEGYVKASMELKELTRERDSITQKKVKNISIEKMNLIESLANMHTSGNRIKEEIIALKNHSEKPTGADLNYAIGAYGYFIEDEEVYDISGDYEVNPFLFYLHPLEYDFNFYKAHISIPELGELPFISPLHPLAVASYKFKLENSFRENGQIIYKIAVIPRRKSEPVFSGHIFIADEEWAIKAVDFSLSPLALNTYTKMQVVQNHEKLEDGTWVARREEFFYEAAEEDFTYIGNTIALYDKHEVNPEFPSKFFNQETSGTADDALQKADERLGAARPITLKTEEIQFIQTQDSIAIAHTSAGYLKEQDSSFNHTNFWDVVLFGMEFQNSFKGRRLYVIPLILQPRFFSPGGYRHALGGYYSKFFKESGKQLDTYAEINYGPLNQDLRGHYKGVYTYNNFNFSKITAGVGSEYELMNRNTSIVANFSPGNYTLTNHLTLGYDREISNGFFVNTTLRYAKHHPVNDLQYPDYVDSFLLAFEEDLPENQSLELDPIDFKPYTKILLDFDIAYRFRQKYRTTAVRKIILGSKYPKVNVNLKLGIPGVLNSVSSFGFAELRIHDRMKFGSYGQSQYNVQIGSFLWDNAVQIVDERFVIGSDYFWYNNPMRGFQLIGPSLSTTQPYFEYHYRHLFDGALMNKVPVLRRLRLCITAGSNGLWLADRDFRHVETYAGLEKKFRIGTELFKAGVFFVNSTSSLSSFETQFKIGLTAYNPVTRNWM